MRHRCITDPGQIISSSRDSKKRAGTTTAIMAEVCGLCCTGAARDHVCQTASFTPPATGPPSGRALVCCGGWGGGLLSSVLWCVCMGADSTRQGFHDRRARPWCQAGSMPLPEPEPGQHGAGADRQAASKRDRTPAGCLRFAWFKGWIFVRKSQPRGAVLVWHPARLPCGCSTAGTSFTVESGTCTWQTSHLCAREMYGESL